MIGLNIRMRNYPKILHTFKQERHSFLEHKATISSKKIDHEILVKASYGTVQVKFDETLIKKAHGYIKKLIETNQAVYGITTSFGGNIKHIIPSTQSHLLQQNLVSTHAANVGTFLPYEICKAATILRFTTVTKGYSGVTLETVKLLQSMLSLGIIPAIRAHGSMGASGDLGPLSAIAYSLTGKGEVYLPDRSTIVKAQKAFKKYDLEPVQPTYRDGLALINGTSVMTAVGSFYLWYLSRLLENSLVIAGITIEALRSSKEPFDPRLHNLKPHHYQIQVASVMNQMLTESKLAKSHDELKEDVELVLKSNTETAKHKTDLQGGSYSLRAIPQIYQPIVSLFNLFKDAVNTEANSVSDNPLVLVDEKEELHGANFHGHPISVIADSLNLAIVSIANISNSRVDRMLKSHHSDLPAFLATGQEGLYLGMQGAQYTAAGICAELRALTQPLSVNQVTTNNDNQDLVSFGLQATLKGIEITYLLSYVLAVEYMSAVQAVWLRLKQDGGSSKLMSPITKAAYEKLLTIYSPQENIDQDMSESIEKVSEFLLLNNLLPENLRQKLGTV